MREPRPRKDGLCALASCRKPRKLAGLKAVYRGEAERDPFCSRPCCEAWHREQAGELPLPVPPVRVAGPPIHGTEHCYVKHRCRCDDCRAATNRARAERRAKQREKEAAA